MALTPDPPEPPPPLNRRHPRKAAAMSKDRIRRIVDDRFAALEVEASDRLRDVIADAALRNSSDEAAAEGLAGRLVDSYARRLVNAARSRRREAREAAKYPEGACRWCREPLPPRRGPGRPRLVHGECKAAYDAEMTRRDRAAALTDADTILDPQTARLRGAEVKRFDDDGADMSPGAGLEVFKWKDPLREPPPDEGEPWTDWDRQRLDLRDAETSLYRQDRRDGDI